jgi:hypothetical protein
MGETVVNSGGMDYAVHRRETALLPVVHVIVLGAGISAGVGGGRDSALDVTTGEGTRRLTRLIAPGARIMHECSA